MKRVWLRAAALVLAAVGVVAGLTVYFSTEEVPRCLVSGGGTFKPPSSGTHHYEVVVLEQSACFFDMDNGHRFAGSQPKSRFGTLAPESDTVDVVDREHRVVYETKPGLLGLRVLDLRTGRLLFLTRFKGYTWNPSFGPDPPSHGVSLAPDRPELWVLDAPNSVVHLFDVSGLPGAAPEPIDDIRLSKPISGDESPCSSNCARIGSLQHSADGRFVYVGDAGDVIDTKTREVVDNLDALHNSRVHFEVDWVDGTLVVQRPR
jgi:hypothetical protein